MSNQRDTIAKFPLLNWLYSAPKDVDIEELSLWIKAKTNGKYFIARKDEKLNLNEESDIKERQGTEYLCKQQQSIYFQSTHINILQ